MPKVAAAVDVSDDERPTSKRSTITKEPSPPQETSEGELGAQDEEEVDQLEYEIEKILKHRNKMFEGSKLGYYVKWKDYGEDQNSWVSEDDAQGATDLISEYWLNLNSKKPRKSTGPPKVPSAEPEEAPSTRKRKATKASKNDDTAGEVVKPVSKVGSVKQTPASQARALKKQKVREESPNIEPNQYGNMEKYMNMASWEKLNPSIETVASTDDGLIVYFEFQPPKGTKDKARCLASICHEKFPQTLLNFYEQHLKWRNLEN